MSERSINKEITGNLLQQTQLSLFKYNKFSIFEYLCFYKNSPFWKRFVLTKILHLWISFVSTKVLHLCCFHQNSPSLSTICFFKKILHLSACLFGLLTSLSTIRLYCGRAPGQSIWQFSVLPHMRQLGDHDFVSAGHLILTPSQPVGSGRPQWKSNPGPPHQEPRALPTELLRPPPPPSLSTICF